MGERALTDVSIDLDPLLGQVVRLRALREDDLPVLCGWWQDQRVAVFQTPGPTRPRPAEGLAELLRTWSKNDGADCALSVTTAVSGELVGHGALFGASVKDRCATLAILVGPEHQGHGYGTDAVRVLLRYGFAELGLHRVELNVIGYNVRAIAAYRKVGFVEEGRRRSAVYRSGGWHDDLKMAMLRSEWEAAATLNR
jgi:RimJ/RimL family protein N-acetyltransferase